MRPFALICSILFFRSILPDSESLACADDRNTSKNVAPRETEPTTIDASIFETIGSSSTTVQSRIDGNDDREDGTDSLPTRHGKHRRRRRCKNRPTCLRGVLASKRPNDARILREENVRENRRGTLERRVSEFVNGKDGSTESVQRDNDTDRADTLGGPDGSDNRAPTDILGQSPKDPEEDGDELDGNGRVTFGNLDAFDSIANGKRGEIEFLDEAIDGNDDYRDDLYFSSTYAAIDQRIALHESSNQLLAKLFQSLRNVSFADGRDIFKINFADVTTEDPCQKWLNSRDKLEEVFSDGLTSLPACPCQYPSNIFYDDKIWDEKHGKRFRWRDVSGESQRLDVYKPGAAYCVRSLLAQGTGSAAAQHCCYDRTRKLLTRGSGAGTPNFVSPEISSVLHERIDVLPWRLCKGDFSRYNGVRPPNNDNGCEQNPDDEEYQRQINRTKHY